MLLDSFEVDLAVDSLIHTHYECWVISRLVWEFSYELWIVWIQLNFFRSAQMPTLVVDRSESC